jgi:hypothetical protein
MVHIIGMIVATPDEMHLIAAHVLERQLVWRDAVMEGKVGYGADVGGFGQRRHITEGHVLDHAVAQWASSASSWNTHAG